MNRFAHGDAYALPDISSVFQRVGKSRYISLADCKAGYWQLPVREEDKWLTAFVCDAGLFEFNRAPFGLKGSGNLFVCALSNILRPTCEFTDSFVDDIAVHSDEWKEHLKDIDHFLNIIRNAGITLSLKKCNGHRVKSNFAAKLLVLAKGLRTVKRSRSLMKWKTLEPRP